MFDIKPNQGKKLEIVVNGIEYLRFPVKTHLISDKDNIVRVVEKYTKPLLKKGDFVFVSERIVAISQGRSYFIKDIKPSRLARFLVKYVHKSPHGIGLGSPWTMQLAIQEAGSFRIIFGSIIAAITKPFGIRGIFYKIVGHNVNAIDGPCSYTLPPGNQQAKLGPKDPEKVATEIEKAVGHEIVIIDSNDLGVNVLGKSKSEIDDNFCKNVFRDNPLGQTKEQTPICIIRKGKSL